MLSEIELQKMKINNQKSLKYGNSLNFEGE